MAVLIALKSVLAIAAPSKLFPVLKARKTKVLRAFLFCTALFGTQNLYAVECPALPIHQTVTVTQVIDGDTLRLADGRRLRLPTINTPELAREGNPEQALALAAQLAVQSFLEDGNPQVGISFGTRRQDRYGRLLAHVIHPSKGNLEAFLVAKGLAFPIPVPPDMTQATCLQDLAEQARREGLGIWANDYWQALDVDELENEQPAFRRVCGQINKVDAASGLWLETQGDLVFRITEQDSIYFNNSNFEISDAKSWPGKYLEAWGWLRDRRDQNDLIARGFKPWVLQVRTPYVLRWVQSCDQ